MNYHRTLHEFVLSGDSGCGRSVGIINVKKVKMYKGSGLLWHNIQTSFHEDTPNGFKSTINKSIRCKKKNK
jgi:hypothetical protein